MGGELRIIGTKEHQTMVWLSTRFPTRTTQSTVSHKRDVCIPCRPSKGTCAPALERRTRLARDGDPRSAAARDGAGNIDDAAPLLRRRRRIIEGDHDLLPHAAEDFDG